MGRPATSLPHIGFTVSLTMSEQPSASVDCGDGDDGPPIGLQIIGRRFDEAGVISLSKTIEAVRASRARPEPPGTARRCQTQSHFNGLVRQWAAWRTVWMTTALSVTSYRIRNE